MHARHDTKKRSQPSYNCSPLCGVETNSDFLSGILGLPHESTRAYIIKWTFRGLVWQWGLLFTDCPLCGQLRDHSGTNL